VKFGSDFWFWLRLLLSILKALLEHAPSNPGPKLPPGHRAFNSILAVLVAENEAASPTAKEFKALEVT